MRIAIIGANGFIGTRLLEKWSILRQRDFTAIVRKPSSLAAISRFPISWKFADALKEDELAKALEGCNAVVHCAIGDSKQIEAMPETLVNASVKAGVKRIVYISSASVHGQKPKQGIDESTPLSDKQAMEYNNAKVRAEQSFFKRLDETKIEGCALRPGVVFGPRSRWVADIANDFLDGKAYLLDEGQGVCNSIYVDNLIHAIERALDVAKLPNAAYLLNDAESVTWKDFYSPIAEAAGKRITDAAFISAPSFPKSLKQKTDAIVNTKLTQSILPLFPGKLKQITKAAINAWSPPIKRGAWRLPEPPSPSPAEEICLLHQCQYKFSYEKAKKELGYNPPTSFEDGMKRSIGWLQYAGVIPQAH